MRFVKMQGTGNDFLLVEAGPSDARDWGALAERICDRHFGAGADGLILVLPSQVADVRMRLFNADGSEAEVSGNGLRCLVKYAVERGVAPANAGSVRVEVAHDILEATLATDKGRVNSVRVSMGAPRFSPKEVPVLAEMEPVVGFPLEVDGERIAVTCLSMGNPHAVMFIGEPVESYPLERLGPKVENHPAFPERVNFGVGRILGSRRIRLRVWERGVGETLACGSGSCAAVVAARLQGRAGKRVQVEQPGGMLTVDWDGEGEVFLSGPAELVYEGDWPEDLSA